MRSARGKKESNEFVSMDIDESMFKGIAEKIRNNESPELRIKQGSLEIPTPHHKTTYKSGKIQSMDTSPIKDSPWKSNNTP